MCVAHKCLHTKTILQLDVYRNCLCGNRGSRRSLFAELCVMCTSRYVKNLNWERKVKLIRCRGNNFNFFSISNIWLQYTHIQLTHVGRVPQLSQLSPTGGEMAERKNVKESFPPTMSISRTFLWL